MIQFLNHFFESAIANISPVRGFQRRAAREQLAKLASGAWRGASKDRIRGSMRNISGDADADTADDLETLRIRSRDLVRNSSLGVGLLGTMVDNIVGATGFRVRPAVTAKGSSGRVTEDQAKAWNELAARAWERWLPHAAADERSDWGGVLRLACRSTLESGDVFAHFLFSPRRGAPYALAVETLEADYVETPGNLLRKANIRSGVVIGTRGQPVSFWTHRNHPGAAIANRVFAPAGSQRDFRNIRRWNSELQRPNMLQLLHVERPGQNRGVPIFGPVIGDLDDLTTLIESEVVATRFAACISAIVKRVNPFATAQERAATTNEKGERLESLQPGIIEYLDPGEDFELVNPQRPGSTFDGFLTRLIRNISRGLGLPYELGSLDFSDTNFSSTKASFLEARRMFRCRQQVYIRFSQVCYEMVLEEAWLRGDLPDLDWPSLREELSRAKWQSPGWGWIEPLKEIQASALAIKERLSTLAFETEHYMGEDWEDNQIQIEREIARRREIAKEAGNAPTETEEEEVEEEDTEDPAGEETSEEEEQEAAAEKRELAGAPA